MKNVYAVINPSTQYVIGYIKTNEDISNETTVPAFAIDTVSGSRKDILSVLLVDSTHPDFNYIEEKYKDLSVNEETQYGITYNNAEFKILTDNLTLKRLKNEISLLEVSSDIKQNLLNLALKKERFILKTLGPKLFKNVKIGDVIVFNDTLFHVKELNEDEQLELAEIKDDFSYGSTIITNAPSVFRVGRF